MDGSGSRGIESSPEESNKKKAKSKKSKKDQQPSDRPKRPLSAYNLFFQAERERILRFAPERPGGKPRRSHGKIGFAALARAIADRWKNIEAWERRFYDDRAAKDKIRYAREIEEWNKKNAARGIGAAGSGGGGGGSDKEIVDPASKEKDDGEGEEEEGDKKPSAKMKKSSPSGRIKVVPPPIAPRLPSSFSLPHPSLESVVQPTIRPLGGFGNSPQIDGSLFPPMVIWQQQQPIGTSTTAAPAAITTAAPAAVAITSEATQQVESLAPATAMLGGGNYYQQVVTFPPETAQHQDSHCNIESQQQQEQELLALQQPYRSNSDSALARLADSLDEESIDFISNLFQDKRHDQWRRGSI